MASDGAKPLHNGVSGGHLEKQCMSIGNDHGESQLAKEVGDAQLSDEGQAAAPFFTASAFTSLVARWLDQIDPQGQALSPAQRQARRLCGRWLLVRRMELDLSYAQLALRTGVNAQTLQCLELGLADVTMAAEPAWEQLYLALAGPLSTAAPGDADFVAALVQAALGQREVLTGPLRQQIERDLAVVDETL
jgi:transcriptional regulator with XRE-family HTH domain